MFSRDRPPPCLPDATAVASAFPMSSPAETGRSLDGSAERPGRALMLKTCGVNADPWLDVAAPLLPSSEDVLGK